MVTHHDFGTVDGQFFETKEEAWDAFGVGTHLFILFPCLNISFGISFGHLAKLWKMAHLYDHFIDNF